MQIFECFFFGILMFLLRYLDLQVWTSECLCASCLFVSRTVWRLCASCLFVSRTVWSFWSLCASCLFVSWTVWSFWSLCFFVCYCLLLSLIVTRLYSHFINVVLLTVCTNNTISSSHLLSSLLTISSSQDSTNRTTPSHLLSSLSSSRFVWTTPIHLTQTEQHHLIFSPFSIPILIIHSLISSPFSIPILIIHSS